MWKTAFKKFEVIWSAQQDCLPQILIGQFLNLCTIHSGKLDKILKYLKLVLYYGYC